MNAVDASIELIGRLQASGFEAVWAGGCVRDRLLGRDFKDIDIATNASPDEVLACFDHTHELGKAFGVVQVLLHGHTFEVATYRRDLEYRDGRRPSGIEPSDAIEDAQRRDFTVNAMFFDPISESVIDHVGGRTDLAARVLRAVGDAAERFREDHLRMLRAIRFAATLGFEIEPATWEAIRTNARNILRVSPERIRTELDRTWLEAEKPGQALWALYNSGLLAEIIPEAIPMHGQEQPPQFHPEGDVFTHTSIMMDLAENRSRVLMWSILFHDIGKPPTATESMEPDGSTRIRFNGHAEVGRDMAREIMQRLKFSRADTEAIETCVARHMDFMNVNQMRDKTRRKMVGRPTFETELELHRVDCMSSNQFMEHYETMVDFAANYEETPALPPPLVTGDDLIALGVAPGPELGQLKQAAYDLQLENPDATRASLLEDLRPQIEAQVS